MYCDEAGARRPGRMMRGRIWRQRGYEGGML